MLRELLQPTQFAHMKHVTEVEPVTEKDRSILEAIKAVLLEHDAVERFGVHLVHKHFDLTEDEIIMEYTDEDARTQFTQVEKYEEAFANGLPLETQWRFNRETASMGCVGFCLYNNGHRHIHNRV